MNKTKKLLVFIYGLSLGLSLDAQLKQLDMSQQFPMKQNQNVNAPERADQYPTQQNSIPIQKRQFNKLNFQKSQYEVKSNSQFQLSTHDRFNTSNLIQTETLEYDKRRPERHRFDGKDANIENLDVIKELVMAPQYQDARRYQYPVKSVTKIRESLDELSMQDINRFEFRSSRSSEPGLPSQKAGGNNNSGASNRSQGPSSTTSGGLMDSNSSSNTQPQSW